MAPLHSTTLCAAVVSVLQCHSQSTGPGNDGCPCNDPQIGTNINFRIDCPQGFGTGWADAMLSDWSYCLAATVLAETEAYQPTYGIGCQKHYEPGDAACFDQATNMELAVADRASWCDDQWCYVDPCDCNSEASQSARFAGASYAYSYVTCGSADAFAATVVGGTESADCAAGQGGCPCSDPLLGSSNYRMTCPQDFGTGWAVAPSTTYCVQATVSNVLVAYAPTYGVGCQKHYEPGAAACFDQATNMELAVADRASWCDDQWCYVDPCNCNSVVSQSLYFAGASYAYSYVTCGSVDAFEATVTGGTEPAECAAGQAGCPCSDPQLGSNANYNINCPQGFGSGWADAVLSTWTYCVQATISGVDTANAVTAAYPPTYGVGCQKHYEPGSSDCFNQVADAELPDADRASWCDNQWCYVDPCNCNADVSQSSYFAGASYAYSYATCGSADEFAATVGGTSTGVCVPTCGTAGNNDGTEMANMPVNAADACACSTLCESTAGCAGYTFVGSSTSCYLRSSWGASVDNVATAVSAQQSSPSPSPTSASPTPTPPAYTCPTGGRNIQLSDLVQGAPFNECICIGDWNTKDYNDEIHVVPKLATGCCPIGSVPGTQATANYQGAQIVCGFTPDGSVNLNINTAFACDYEQCYVDRQNIPCADGSSVRLNGCCAGSPSGSGDVTDTARLAFADSASCLGYAYEIFTVHSFTDLFEYCTHYNSVYSSGTDVGTALVSDDVDAAEAGFNTDNYATYARCVGGSVEDTDSSGVGRFGLSMCIVGIAGLAL